MSNIFGYINKFSDGESIIGFLLSSLDSEQRVAILYIDDKYYEINCNIDNDYIKFKHGKHGFKFIIPSIFKDGKPHTVKLIDKNTLKMCYQCSIFLKNNKINDLCSGQELLSSLEYKFKKVAILIPTPSQEDAPWWGDYHYACSMKKEFDKRNYHTEIRYLPDWDKPFDGKIVIVLRGLSRYHPKNEHINIMWNISHPKNIKVEEYNSYDIVYIASKKYTKILKTKLKTYVEELQQCTDPEIFDVNNNNIMYDIVFVGNTRNIKRKSVEYIMPSNYKIGIWGRGWESFVDKKYISGQNYDNNKLGMLYSSSKFVLNDHWDDMKEYGFISNRVFDGFASGSFVMTDHVDQIEEIFPNIITYSNRDDLRRLIDYYIKNDKQRREYVEEIKQSVLKHHTFSNRISKIINDIEEIKSILM